MRSMQCNVEFGYQLSIRSGTKETTENLDRVGRKACDSERAKIFHFTGIILRLRYRLLTMVY
jgi:hypothetical protein